MYIPFSTCIIYSVSFNCSLCSCVLLGGKNISIRALYFCFSKWWASKVEPLSSTLQFLLPLSSMKLFPNHFYLALARVFYCSLESISNMKILHNSDTVTTQLICGSWKAGNTAYFFYPLPLIGFTAASTLFWESMFTLKYCLLIHMCYGNHFYS